MDKDSRDRRIDYIEFPATDLTASKRFYAAIFGWSYKDWGEDYSDSGDGGLMHGLSAAGDRVRAPLVTVYATDLEAARERVRAAGGAITRDIFEFPGGRRFHFTDPAGNQLAVWSKAAG